MCIFILDDDEDDNEEEEEEESSVNVNGLKGVVHKPKAAKGLSSEVHIYICIIYASICMYIKMHICMYVKMHILICKHICMSLYVCDPAQKGIIALIPAAAMRVGLLARVVDQWRHISYSGLWCFLSVLRDKYM
jgi:hypothetical protein